MLFVKANFTCLKIHVETEDYANTLAKITDREKKSFFFFLVERKWELQWIRGHDDGSNNYSDSVNWPTTISWLGNVGLLNFGAARWSPVKLLLRSNCVLYVHQLERFFFFFSTVSTSTHYVFLAGPKRNLLIIYSGSLRKTPSNLRQMFLAFLAWIGILSGVYVVINWGNKRDDQIRIIIWNTKSKAGYMMVTGMTVHTKSKEERHPLHSVSFQAHIRLQQTCLIRFLFFVMLHNF